MNQWGLLIKERVRRLVSRAKRYFQKADVTYEEPFTVTVLVNRRQHPIVKSMRITITPGREQRLYRGEPVGEPIDWWIGIAETTMIDGTVYTAKIVNSWNLRAAIQQARLKGLEITVGHGYRMLGGETAQTGRG